MNFVYKILSFLNIITLCLAMLCGNYPGFTAAELDYETAYGNPMKGFMPFSARMVPIPPCRTAWNGSIFR